MFKNKHKKNEPCTLIQKSYALYVTHNQNIAPIFRNTLYSNSSLQSTRIGESAPRSDIGATKTRQADSFGQNVSNQEATRANLPGEYYRKLQEATKQGVAIERDLADAVASAMKSWALTIGATDYPHWFKPLTRACEQLN